MLANKVHTHVNAIEIQIIRRNDDDDVGLQFSMLHFLRVSASAHTHSGSHLNGLDLD